MSALRWGRTALEGTATASLRWGRAALEGTAAVLLAALQPLTVEPQSAVSITAARLGGGTVDTWAWRKISGPTISLSGGTTATVSFEAPSGMPPAGATVVLGVIGTTGGTASPEQTVTVTVLPALRWVWLSGGFVGAKRA